MADTLRAEGARDAEVPDELKDDLERVGVKYRRFRELSRDAVYEVKDTAEVFERWLRRIKEEVEAARESRAGRIARILVRMASKLEPLQGKLGKCLGAYGEAQADINAVADRTLELQERSDSRAGALMMLTAAAAVIAPAALLAEEGLLALAAGSAGLAGRSLNADYNDLSRFYARFLATTRKVAEKVQAEKEELGGVSGALDVAAQEVACVAQDLDEDALDFLAYTAEEAGESFAKLAKRCDDFLAASKYAESTPTRLLGC
uniref:Uncharacterized protein n=1 Tax=Zooxanthella nutricula TaxID=1333877 RepID=A0A7S2QC96_9DINO